MKKNIKNIKNIMLIFVSVILSLVYIFNYEVIGDIYNLAIGKVSKNFGNDLGRDLDYDGDNDSGVVLNSIVGGNGDDYGKSIYVDNSNKVYITGCSSNGSNLNMYVIRLNENGSMDSTFGRKGKVVINNIAGGNSYDYGQSIYVDGNNRIYVTGWSDNGKNNDVYVIRLNEDGSMDNTFGKKGKVVINNIASSNSDDYAYSIYVDNSGKIYITGDSYNGSNLDMYVLKIE
ncbi:MAG: delta-60 repeat domain-containing protein [bacterium]